MIPRDAPSSPSTTIPPTEFRTGHINRPMSPHVLRHTIAVTALQRNISLPSLQRFLRHDHLGTTLIYLNHSPEEVIREFNEKW